MQLTHEQLADINRRWTKGDYISFNERLAVVTAATAGMLLAEVRTNLAGHPVADQLATIEAVACKKALETMR